MSVKRCQQEVDAREFEAWLAYSQLEPWDETRADLRAGIIANVMANVHRGKETEPFSLSDFMPQYGVEDDAAVDEDAMIAQQQALFLWMTESAGGTVLEG
jgi:hypothetical protein